MFEDLLMYYYITVSLCFRGKITHRDIRFQMNGAEALGAVFAY